MALIKAEPKSLIKRHNDAVRQLENYKLLVDSVQDYAIFLLDSEGYIQTWNKGAQRIKGYTEDEIVGQHFSKFYTDADKKAKKPEKELIQARKTGTAEDEDWRVKRNGSRFWASVVITALYDNNKKLIGFAKVTRDLSDRKKQEDKLMSANQQLRTQQTELKLLNQSKDDFISLASHQLRTPATVVKQMLGLFVDGLITGIDEKHLNLIDKAYVSNERLINTINDLLKVAQVDSGKMHLTKSRFNLTKLIEEIMEDFKDTIKNRRQVITLNSKNKKLMIYADKKNLRMALENLISNASKYSYASGSIDVTVQEKDDNIEIAVSDNGVGIAKGDVEHLFNKFVRLPNDLSDEVGGTGLGLYWAKSVVELHGGRIELESELNEGSTFNVILPAS